MAWSACHSSSRTICSRIWSSRIAAPTTTAPSKPSSDRNAWRTSIARNANIRAVLARSPSPPPVWLARTERALAVAVTLVALALHVRLCLSAGPLWRDEINTVVVATQPTLAGVWDRLEGDSFPLLPYALLRLWRSRLPGTDAGLRAFGLIVGLSAVAALWWDRRRARLAPPLLALSLFAINPVVVRWGDSIRGYGL